MHATHGSAGDLSALDQTQDPERVSKLMNRPTSDSTKPGRSDIEELLSNPSATTSTKTTTSHSVRVSTTSSLHREAYSAIVHTGNLRSIYACLVYFGLHRVATSMCKGTTTASMQDT